MKKKFYAILLTASFLIGIMATMALASVTTLYVEYGEGDNEKVTQDSAGTGELNLTLPQFTSKTITVSIYTSAAESVSANITKAGSNVTITKTSMSGTSSKPTGATGYFLGDTFIVEAVSGTSDKVTIEAGDFIVNLNIEIEPANPPTWHTDSLINATAGADYLATTNYPNSDGLIFSGQELKSTDVTKMFKASTTISSKDLTMKADFKQSITGIKLATLKSGNDITGWLEGTAPSVKAEATYEVTITVNDKSNQPISQTATFKISPAPKINTSKKPGDIVWGEEFSFTPTLSAGSVNESGGWTISDDEREGYLTAANLEKQGLTFSGTDGSITGTWSATTASTDADIVKWTGTDVTKKIAVKATKGTSDKKAVDTIEYTLKFKGVVPTITETASDVTTAFTEVNSNKGFMYGDAVAAANGVKLTANGPDSIHWTVTPATGKLSDYGLELTSADATGEEKAYLQIHGTPTTTVKSLKLTIEAVNSKGKSTSITPTFTIGSEKFGIFTDAEGTTDAEDATMNMTGDKKVGDSFGDSVILYAKPGPVTWTATNLPDGITLTVNTKDSTKATLSGTYKTARKAKDADSQHYSIRAVNTNFNTLDATLSDDVMVWTKPEITTATLFKKNVIETNKDYDFEVVASNLPDSDDWVVKAGTTSILSANATAGTAYAANGGVSTISVDMAALIDDGKLKLIGSLDRVPAKGEAIKFSITAGNYAGTDTKEFVVTVKGVAPALKKEDITLSDSTPKDIKVSAGDPEIKMNAYIEAKTAKKIFGDNYDNDIDLTKANNVSGLLFRNSNTDGTASIEYIGDSAVAWDSVAYKKLPFVVEASNTDISTKVAKATYTVTIPTTEKPYLEVSNDLTAYNSALEAESTLPATVNITTEAGTALEKDLFVFNARGDGPFTITVKPLEKNSLIATVNETARTVSINGTPTAEKKDVATKFTITVKNNSTGETAKSDITITAKPKPVIAADLEKTVLVGKKVKLTPKATASASGMVWAVESVSGGSSSGAGALSDTDLDSLKELYGLEFDTVKGTISGTAKAPTGKDDPIVITFYASSDISQSATKTAKITILGAKPKLTTKKLTVSTGETLSDVTIDTNLKGKEVAEANVTFSPTTLTEALAGVTVDTTTTPNVGTLTGKATSATKKQTVEFTLDNYGSEGKGKVTFMVVDPAPEITGDSDITVSAGESEMAEISVSNSTNSELKYKWKISKKPSGVTAKIKGNGNKATITVKAAKKAKDGETSLEVTVTDPLTKQTSATAWPISITVNGVAEEDTEAAPLEAKDVAATPEAKTEAEKSDEKVIGEGEVHMGAERTADKLTAQQRKFFEDEGYVIAAVLPEIEVTAAGQYDFEVDLDKEVETGAELVWFAFASKPTTDDEIVDFADEKGKETKVVPESHVVTVAPWLNAETKYAPVIAVKAAAKDADATTVEGVKEAAEAKTEE